MSKVITRPLSDLVIEAQSGFASGEKSEDGVAQIRMNNITIDGSLDMSSIRRIPRNAVSNINKYLLNDGDILFNATNSPTLVGKTARFVDQGEPFTFSNHFVRLTVDPNQLDSHYLARWLTLQQQRGVFALLCTQWVNQASVRKEDLLAQQIPLPPLAEQKRIAAILDQADALRRKRRAALARLDTLVQSLFLEMFGDPVTNPMGWKRVTIEDLCIDIVDCPHTTPIYAEGITEYPCIRTSDLQNGFLDFSTTKYVDAEQYDLRIRRRKPIEGDVLYSREGERYGIAALVPSGITPCLGQRMMLFHHNHKVAQPAFLWALLNSRAVYQQASRLVGGSTSPHINVRDIKSFNVYAPDIELQNQFHAAVLKIDSLRNRQITGQHSAERLFHALQQRAFRGDL